MRRTLAALVLLVCVAISAGAQNVPPLPLVGVLRLNTASSSEPFASLLRNAFSSLGYIDGRNIRIDMRLAEGDPGRFPRIAEMLVGEGASVIIAIGLPAAQAARSATSTTPIIAAVSDLVASGLINTLATPGGNITGESHFVPELDAKKLELLKELLPTAHRFGVINDRSGTLATTLASITERARALGIELVIADVASAADLSPAIASFQHAGVEAVEIPDTILMSSLRSELGALLLKHRIPAICEWPEMAAAGCLASYGGTLRELAATLADLTGQILKGASPAMTPARQPTKFELVVNLKTAKALGLTVPQSLLARADEVIE